MQAKSKNWWWNFYARNTESVFNSESEFCGLYVFSTGKTYYFLSTKKLVNTFHPHLWSSNKILFFLYQRKTLIGRNLGPSSLRRRQRTSRKIKPISYKTQTFFQIIYFVQMYKSIKNKGVSIIGNFKNVYNYHKECSRCIFRYCFATSVHCFHKSDLKFKNKINLSIHQLQRFQCEQMKIHRMAFSKHRNKINNHRTL